MTYEQYRQYEIAQQCDSVRRYLYWVASEFDWDGNLTEDDILIITHKMENISSTLKNKNRK